MKNNMKQNKWKILISAGIILLPVLFGLAIWNRLPEQMPTHWNMAGEVDGWSSKAFTVFGLPGILLGAHLACILGTRTDPKNKDQNRKVMGMVLWLCPVVSLVVSGMTYGAALGMEMNVKLQASVLLGAMFIIIGNYLPKTKQNYTIGIKVPWALHSEENWDRTHRLAGRLWVAGGILMLATVFLPQDWTWPVMLVGLVIPTILPMGYSYLLYRKETRK